MATNGRRRLVLHGEQNIVRWQLNDERELNVETFDAGGERNEHTSLTFDRAEMRDMHSFLGRALATKKKGR